MNVDILDKKYNYAVIGASKNKKKYGFKVLQSLLKSGYHVFPVNPKGGDILGLSSFKSISEIDFVIDAAIFVVPPAIVKKILPELCKKNIKKAWFQPGSESEDALNFCRNNDIEYIYNQCVIINNKL